MTPKRKPKKLVTMDDLLDGVAYMMAEAFEKWKALEILKERKRP